MAQYSVKPPAAPPSAPTSVYLRNKTQRRCFESILTPPAPASHGRKPAWRPLVTWTAPQSSSGLPRSSMGCIRARYASSRRAAPYRSCRTTAKSTNTAERRSYCHSTVRASHGQLPRGSRPVEGGYERIDAQKLYHALAVVNGVSVPGKAGENGHMVGGCLACRWTA
ncbi:hypothetical protein V8D89_001035 [Ganoderma adspersum]